MHKWKHRLFALIPFILVFLILETGLRVYHRSHKIPPDKTKMEEYLKYAHVPHARFQYTKSSFSVNVEQNSIGAHDVEHSLKKDKGVKRILVIGDSFVESYQVSLEKIFTRRLEQLLNRSVKESKYEVISLGMSGYGSEKEYHLLRNIGIKFNPDLVILLFLEENDIRDVSLSLSGDVRRWNEFEKNLKKIVSESRYIMPFSRYSYLL